MSSGWLHKFRNQHMIRFRQISGESVSVITTITDEWKHCFPTIVNGYNDDDVYNADETALLFKPMSDRSLVFSKEDCKEGKRSKERHTILLGWNWSRSDTLKPVAIDKTVHITFADYNR